MLNIWLCLDLILTFRSPFMKPESRYPLYITSSVMLSLFPGVIRSMGLAKSSNQFAYGWIIITFFIAYLCIAFFSIYYAWRHLNRPGMSSEARGMIARRHISYIFMNVLCQSYNVFSKFTTNIDPEKGYSGYLLFILIILYFG